MECPRRITEVLNDQLGQNTWQIDRGVDTWLGVRLDGIGYIPKINIYYNLCHLFHAVNNVDSKTTTK